MVFNPHMVDNYAFFFNCTTVGLASDLWPPSKSFIRGLVPATMSLVGSMVVSLEVFFSSGFHCL